MFVSETAKKVLELNALYPTMTWAEIGRNIGKSPQYARNVAWQARKYGLSIENKPSGDRQKHHLSREEMYDAILYALSQAGRALSADEIADFCRNRLKVDSPLLNALSIAQYAKSLRLLGLLRIARIRDKNIWMLSDRKYHEFTRNKYKRATLYFTD